jgi:hypothetical protein
MRIAASRSPNAERVVTPLELFFDLVYVFAIGQLSHHLLEHINLRTGAETVILALAVFYAWYMTAWGANWLEPDRLPVQLLLVGLMFVSLLMSVAIAEAFGGRAWLFVAAYLLLQVGRAAFLIVALRGRALGDHFVNVLVWELIAGGLWVAGAIAEGTARLALLGVCGGGQLWRSGDIALVAWPWPTRRSRANRHRGRAPHRALPAVLPYRAGGERADRRQCVHRRAVRSRAPACVGDRIHGNRRALVVLLVPVPAATPRALTQLGR